MSSLLFAIRSGAGCSAISSVLAIVGGVLSLINICLSRAMGSATERSFIFAGSEIACRTLALELLAKVGHGEKAAVELYALLDDYASLTADELLKKPGAVALLMRLAEEGNGNAAEICACLPESVCARAASG
jgi:hypothetical protein